MMIIQRSRLTFFHHAFLRLSGSLAEPERLRERCMEKFDDLDSPSSRERLAAVRTLGAFCLLHSDAEAAPRILRLFEHYAQFSDFEDVRLACLDNLYLARQLSRLQSLVFETGCLPTQIHRDSLVRELREETALAN
ncbi:MAG: hypothetical protein AB1529_02725 [Candidatus Micrarchaeota archaeon]